MGVDTVVKEIPFGRNYKIPHFPVERNGVRTVLYKGSIEKVEQGSSIYI